MSTLGNAPAEGYTKKFNLSWHHPALYLIVLAGVLIYVIVALIVRKTARVNIPLCPAHRAKRRNIILTGLGVFPYNAPGRTGLARVGENPPAAPEPAAGGESPSDTPPRVPP